MSADVFGAYLTVCFVSFFSGDHTETVDIDYDPDVTSYGAMLKLFWRNHDTSTCNSNQYMSVIFYHDEHQHELAMATMTEQEKTSRRKIVTKILPANTFYNAEK